MPDPYLYPKTNILINKFDILDSEKLDEVENDLVYIKLFEVDDFFNVINFDSQGLKKLHRYLFEDIYMWAGEFRTINIHKYERVLPGASVDYCDYMLIAKHMDTAMGELASIKWSTLSLLERVSMFSRLFARIWQIHPFREGNTRTITTFMFGYAKRCEISIDISLLTTYNAYVRDSLVMASIGEYSECEHLEKIILEAMSGDKNSGEGTYEAAEQYARINEYEVKEYHYRQFESE